MVEGIRKMNYGESLQKVRETNPAVQCITNFVTVNDCANIILAAGGTPAMTMDVREVREGVEGMDALVCNLGAIESVDSMIIAGQHANELGIPVVLDPVAAGNTTLRRYSIRELLETVHFTAIRGNASEIRAIASGGLEAKTGRGVDVSAEDEITTGNLKNTVEMAKELAMRIRSVIAVSGETDIVTDGVHTVILRNGCATMARITGSGCMVTSLIGGFCGADRENPFRAVVSAMTVMGLAGEIAEMQRLKKGTGNATFRTDLIDAVFNMAPEQVDKGIRCQEDRGNA